MGEHIFLLEKYRSYEIGDSKNVSEYKIQQILKKSEKQRCWKNFNF
jgi:hypothetical protein